MWKSEQRCCVTVNTLLFSEAVLKCTKCAMCIVYYAIYNIYNVYTTHIDLLMYKVIRNIERR